MRVSLIQFAAGASKAENLAKARHLIRQAVQQHQPQLVVLPECFNSPYGAQHFSSYAERISAQEETFRFLSEEARTGQVYLVGGSIPERDDQGRLYNTSLTFGPGGELLGQFRKMHLFDIDVPGKITFFESSVLSPGEQPFSFTLQHKGLDYRIGVGICFDIRFPELAAFYARRHQCHAIVYPGAFNLTTGPAHWDMLARCRAVDNQLYTVLCSPARVPEAEQKPGQYIAYGHSVVHDPWGEVLARAGHGEEIICADLPLDRIEEIRKQLPVFTNARQGALWKQ